MLAVFPNVHVDLRSYWFSAPNWSPSGQAARSEATQGKAVTIILLLLSATLSRAVNLCLTVNLSRRPLPLPLLPNFKLTIKDRTTDNVFSTLAL